MINDGPYIIVDNRRIAPIERLPRSDAATDDRRGREAQPFGVVDRVTISREAREQSLQQQNPSDATAPVLGSMQKKPPASSPLLTYSAKQLR